MIMNLCFRTEKAHFPCCRHRHRLPARDASESHKHTYICMEINGHDEYTQRALFRASAAINKFPEVVYGFSLSLLFHFVRSSNFIALY